MFRYREHIMYLTFSFSAIPIVDVIQFFFSGGGGEGCLTTGEAAKKGESYRHFYLSARTQHERISNT